MKYSQSEIDEAIASLKKFIKPGDTVYTILRHVSSSGMSRNISLVALVDGKPVFLDWYIERALGYSRAKNTEGLKVGGCGMDMGFHLVYSLGSVLFRGESWKCSGDNCPYNEHFNDHAKYPRIKGRKHSGDAGYTLRQSWL